MKNFFFISVIFLIIIFIFACFFLYDSNQNFSSIVGIKPKCVFFDLGANRGDTIEKFFNGKLIDIKNFKSDKWIIHAFEPNPNFKTKLNEVKNKISSEKADIHLYLETAAWTKDGKMDLYFDSSTNSEGTSLFKNHPAVKKNNSFSVKTVDIAKLIDSYEEKDFVLVKIDIEGAEYDMLLHLIKMNIFPKIDVVIIEFHKYMSKFKNPEDVFTSLFKLYGTKFINWY